jgi:hypothetical protein
MERWVNNAVTYYLARPREFDEAEVVQAARDQFWM